MTAHTFDIVDAAAEACTHVDRLPDTLGPHHFETTLKRELDGSWTEKVACYCKVCKTHLSTRVTVDHDTPRANGFTEYHNAEFAARMTMRKP